MQQLIGAVAGIGLALTALWTFAPIVRAYFAAPVATTDAGQVTALAEAVDRHITTRWTATLAAASGSLVVLTPADLQPPSSTALDPAYVDRNSRQQSHAAIIRRLTDAGGAPLDQLHVLVSTCGGAAIPEPELQQIAQRVRPNGVMILAATPTILQGATGQQQGLVADFQQTTCPLAAGHFGRLIHYDGSEAQPSYANRNPVPGAGIDPNTFHTDMYWDEPTAIRFLDSAGAADPAAVIDRGRSRMINSEYTNQTAGNTCPSDARYGLSATGESLVCRGGYWRFAKIQKSSVSTCNASTDGEIRWNNASNKGEYCDGAGGSPQWRPFSSAAAVPTYTGICPNTWAGGGDKRDYLLPGYQVYYSASKGDEYGDNDGPPNIYWVTNFCTHICGWDAAKRTPPLTNYCILYSASSGGGSCFCATDTR